MTDNLISPGMVSAARLLALDRAAVATSELLAAAGIDSVLLKGPVTAQRLYADERRLWVDIDLLVAPDRYLDAESVLEDAGYVCPTPATTRRNVAGKESEWRAPGPLKLTIDLHHTYHGVLLLDRFWAELLDDSEEFILGSGRVRAPSLVGTALLVALHNADPAHRAQPVRDLDRALSALPESIWRQAAQRARSCDAEVWFRAGLSRSDQGLTLLSQLELDPATVDDVQRVEIRQRALIARANGRNGEKRSSAAFYFRLVHPDRARLGVVVPQFASGEWSEPRARWWRTRRLMARETTALARFAGAATRSTPRAFVRTAAWTLRASRSVRAQLRTDQYTSVHIDPAPPVDLKAEATMLRVLDARRSLCLESALIRQHWFSSAGDRPRTRDRRASARCRVLGARLARRRRHR